MVTQRAETHGLIKPHLVTDVGTKHMQHRSTRVGLDEAACDTSRTTTRCTRTWLEWARKLYSEAKHCRQLADLRLYSRIPLGSIYVHRGRLPVILSIQRSVLVAWVLVCRNIPTVRMAAGRHENAIRRRYRIGNGGVGPRPGSDPQRFRGMPMGVWRHPLNSTPSGDSRVHGHSSGQNAMGWCGPIACLSGRGNLRSRAQDRPFLPGFNACITGSG